jgi:3-oxoacyl-[acyl-carrier-protein] synthase-3
MVPVALTGLGVYLPRRMLDNGELPALDPPVAREKLDALGIATRGWAAEDESVVEMALHASRAALAEARASAESLDFIVLANWSERRYVPDVAPRIAHALGAKRAFAYDLCGACCGFIYGLTNAWGYLHNPRMQRGLVIASDRSSVRMRPGSRASVVFGDAAAAAVIERSEPESAATKGNESPRGIRLLDYELRTDGARNDIMEVDADGYLLPHIRQQELNPLAGGSMATIANALLDRNRLRWSDVDYVVPHSGTAGVQLQLLEHLGLAPEKVLTNLPTIGNVTTASIPCSLRHFLDRGTLRTGQTVLSVSVGLGWHYVGMLFRT